MRVLLTNWASAANTGDYAILRAQVAALREMLGCDVQVLGGHPGAELPPDIGAVHCANQPWGSPGVSGYRSWAVHALKSMLAIAVPTAVESRWPDYATALRSLRNTDMVMPEGGGYFLSDGSFRKLAFLLRSLWPLLMARRLGKRRIVIGHSIGPVDTRSLAGWLASRVLRLALGGATIVVRDERSVETCARLGLGGVHRLPDIALLTETGKVRSTEATIRDGEVHIGVTVKRLAASRSEMIRYLDSMAAAIIGICEFELGRSCSVYVHLFPQVTGPSPEEDDRPVLEELAALLRTRLAAWPAGAMSPVVIVETPFAGVDDAVQRYGSLDFLVATRMHSAVLAACAGVPFFLFGYVGGKAEGLVADLQLPSWVTTRDLEELRANALRCFAERQALQKAISVGVETARARLWGGLREVLLQGQAQAVEWTAG